MAAAAVPNTTALFEEAVRGVFGEWTALRLAAENRWGGPASSEKAAELADEVLALFRRPADAPASWHAPYSDELEELFDDWMQNELAVLVEDGSIEEVAALVVRIHEECARGELATAMRVCQRTRATAAKAAAASRRAAAPDEMAPAKRSANREARAAHAMEGFPEEDDGESDEEVSDEDEVEVQEKPRRHAPQVDEDGWQVAGPGKRGQRLARK